MTAEQAKAESTQRALEEERRTLSMQINMEREELERAKVRMTRADRRKELILIPHTCPLTLLPASLSIRVHYWRSKNQWCSALRRRGGNWQPSGLTSTPRRSRGTRGLSGRSAVSWRRERAPLWVWHRWASQCRTDGLIFYQLLYNLKRIYQMSLQK